MNDTETSELREHFDATDLSTDIEAATWEADVDDDPMIVTSLRLPKSLLDWVRRRAEAERTKPTALIRRWVEDQRASESGSDAALAGLTARVDRLESVALRVIGSARAGEEDAAGDSISDLLAALQRSVDVARRSAPPDEEPPSASRRGA